MVAITVLVVSTMSCVRNFIMMMINTFLLELTLLGWSMFLAVVIFRLLQVRQFETEIKQLQHELGTKKNDDELNPTAPPYSEYTDSSERNSTHILKFPDYVPQISSLISSLKLDPEEKLMEDKSDSKKWQSMVGLRY